MSKKVLMYSGGLDSFIISRNFEFDVIVFAVLGNDDNMREHNRMADDKYFNRGEVKVVELPLSDFELPNKIIPYRNHMLALTGAQYGSDIYFGFTGGDTTKDKDFVFKAQMEGIMNYFALDQHKVAHEAYPYTIQMPYKDHAKGEMVREYRRGGNRMADLWQVSRSCYAGEAKECGMCRSCLRKYTALFVNGISDVHKIFANDPRPHMAQFFVECSTKGRFAKELAEVHAAIDGRALYDNYSSTVAEEEGEERP